MDSKHNMKTEFEQAFLLLSNKVILAPLPNPHHHPHSSPLFLDALASLKTMVKIK